MLDQGLLDGVTRISQSTEVTEKASREAALNASGDPTTVYRFYDANDKLLYVGITKNLSRRLAAHTKTKEWWLNVASIKLEHFKNRESARLREKTYTMFLDPKHNKQDRWIPDRDLLKPMR